MAVVGDMARLHAWTRLKKSQTLKRRMAEAAGDFIVRNLLRLGVSAVATGLLFVTVGFFGIMWFGVKQLF